LDIGDHASLEQQLGHPTYTVVINNSIVNVEQFGFLPIEWLRGWFF
jgi:hypothetical protein